jgi:MarR family transcriptional regulator, organic hydroperoxide resistance regulator
MVATVAKKKEKDKEKASSSDRSERLGEVLDFMRLLWAVDHALQSMSKRMEGSIGVTGPQRLVIRIAGRFPGISAGELASVLHIHPSTLTGILKRLEARGIIDRKTDPSDARRALFGLTAKGREIDAMRVGTVEAVVRRTLGRLPSRKVTAARDVLATISTALLDQNE